MKFMDQHTWELLRHTLRNFVVVVAMLAVAVALDFAHRGCERIGVSPWLVLGIELMAKGVFLFDGILFVATTAIVGAHFVRESFRKFFGK